jgi:MTH538 TIR-like domain (DUF1863)
MVPPGPSASGAGTKRTVEYDAFISYSHVADVHVAMALQRGLQRLAKPWYRRRALRVFRDESDLTASPKLWSSIAAAIDRSDAFLLMASPEAAESKWVAQEVRRWRETHSMDRFYIAISNGEILWDDVRGDFDWSRTNCLPRALGGAFDEEPLFVDLRFIRSEEAADLRNPQLRAAVARLAAALRDLELDDLISEDVRLHRNAMRLAWSGVSALIFATAAAVVGGVVATRASDEAERRALPTRDASRSRAYSLNR